jgi:hypothetical protein
LAGIPDEQVVEGNPRNGPKGKNPWIETRACTLMRPRVVYSRVNVQGAAMVWPLSKLMVAPALSHGLPQRQDSD